MVRGGPANRAIRKAKIFAITKASNSIQCRDKVA